MVRDYEVRGIQPPLAVAAAIASALGTTVDDLLDQEVTTDA
jgi:hypothetical protein